MSDPVAAGPGIAPVVGSFRFAFATGRWEWSAEVYRMHGYRPGEVAPTTELLLAHKHPDDRDQVAEVIARCVERGEPFSSRHRFLDTAGGEHTVMVVADRILDENGVAVGTSGFYIEIGGPLAEAERAALDAALPDPVEARAVFEQAKGVLMRMYGISAEQACKVLLWRARTTGLPPRELAEQLLAELPLVPPPPPETVAAFDHILLTLHERTGGR
ncbi:PAS and ANTAR domain-containing protein [Nocardia sp. CDC159]|uniref:histidine kinase n=1 Tax=Nocardia pulmonis TaxID=2951408 RepID=A0A9X2E2R4_9NOCA|nr:MULTISPECIES: PAS and ANTAR domain-containing protein [Nocardia]MCM6772038.1 PAS and ANTAR domain-containing protein [Nocardia pulmonis]MCM6785304.1 PAS and ANTAR domain-containing protein [Nocardia sp. CDC159]